MQKISFRIHPCIGIARVGNSPEFVLSPESLTGMPVSAGSAVVGGLPIRAGTESTPITSMDLRDGSGALKRHAARFRVFAYPEESAGRYPSGAGQEVQIGTVIDGRRVRDIVWSVHLANKKANWFVLVEEGDKQGIASYVGGLPPLRNWPTKTPDSQARQPDDGDKLKVLNSTARMTTLVIDPGPRVVAGASTPPVSFDSETPASYLDPRGEIVSAPSYPKSFPANSHVDMDAPGGPINTLGEIRTDEFGRLIVTGGYGRAVGRKVHGAPVQLDDDVNNNNWFDDASDGPVNAMLIFEDGNREAVHGAWVTATDPSYAPQILNSVSLWDDVYDCWVREMNLAPQLYENGYKKDYQPFFEIEISPIFRSAALQQWVVNMNPRGRSVHDSIGEITADSAPSSSPLSGILPIFRNPNIDQSDDTKLMPLHLGDASQAMLALRKTQYFFLEQWNAGAFQKGSGPALGPGELLDKATLMSCLGGRFSPGIDLTFVMREPSVYLSDWRKSGAGPFRLRAKPLDYGAAAPSLPFLTAGYVPRHVEDGLEPGDLSKFMALPWHTDYNSCATHPISPNPNGIRTLFWSWPAQRPVAVYAAADVSGLEVTDPITLKKHMDAQLGDQRWSVRGPGTESALPQNWGRYQDRLDMLDNWHKIGVVMQDTAIVSGEKDKGKDKKGCELPKNPKWFLETGSLLLEDKPAHVEPFPNYNVPAPDEREVFYRLVSNKSPDAETLRQARAFTQHWLEWAEKFSNNVRSTPIDQRFFPYTEEAFQERLDLIYQELVDAADASDPANDSLFKTRQDMLTRIIQMTPLNLLDGAWLRNIGKAGPIDEVRSLLYSILMDELGDGETSKNHCNIYLDLCHSVGYYPHPIDSREFAFDPGFLQSAFTVPAFELAISQFTDDYYPEIIGMTLQLEWEVVELKPTRDLLRYFGIDPHFYVMHIGIDNAVNGHGQRAADAVRIYLQNVRAEGGEAAVQAAWRRIWNGFVAFGNMGTFGTDLYWLIKKHQTLEQRVLDLIVRKAKYGNSNHQQHTIGATRINQWFADPPGFLKALVEHGWLTPGDWNNSRFRALLDFETGPMFRVFTDDEIALWRDYTNSIGKPQPAPAEQCVSPARAMALLIEQLRSVQLGTPGHKSAILGDDKGELHNMDWWFRQPTRALLEALKDPKNGLIVPGKPAESRFVMDLIAPTGPMGAAFSTDAAPPNTGSCRDVVVCWIRHGCPLLDAEPRTLRLNTLGTKRDRHPTGKIHGMGTIH